MAGETPDAGTDDLNEAVREEWKADTTVLERVQQVLRATTDAEPVTALAERAAVSEPSARKHLEMLADLGHAVRVDDDSGVRYRRSPKLPVLQRIDELQQAYTRAELVEGIDDLEARLGDYRDEYDAADPEDLVWQYANEESDDEVPWETVAAWRGTRENLRIARGALALWDVDDEPAEPARSASEESDEERRGTFATERWDPGSRRTA